MKIGGHDFNDFNTDRENTVSCGTCGMSYRDFLRDGGGCVSTGPHIVTDAAGNPPAVFYVNQPDADLSGVVLPDVKPVVIGPLLPLGE